MNPFKRWHTAKSNRGTERRPTDEILCENIFIRDCYLRCYDLLVSQVTTQTIHISLTGSISIGKTIFAIYLFERYRMENPTRTVVTACFDKRRKLQECFIYPAGQNNGIPCRDIPEVRDSIHLYLGSPLASPHESSICFTDLNEDWFSRQVKSSFHRELYLPLWSIEELLEANRISPRQLDPEVIRERYSFFGGIAGICLCCDDRRVSFERREMNRKISMVRSFARLHDSVYEYTKRWKSDFHPFLVIQPREAGLGPGVLTFPSRVVSRLLDQKITKRDEVSRRSLLRSENSKTIRIREWLFSGYCKDQLATGAVFVMYDDLGNATPFSIPPDTTIDVPVLDSVSSIDGVFVDTTNQTLVLLQAVWSTARPTSNEEILIVLGSVEKTATLTDILIVYMGPDVDDEADLSRIQGISSLRAAVHALDTINTSKQVRRSFLVLDLDLNWRSRQDPTNPRKMQRLG